MSRAHILGSIGASLDAATDVAARRRSVAQRLAQPPAHPRPRRAMHEGAERVAQFKQFQRALGVDVVDVGSDTEVPAAIAGYLAALGLPLRLRCGNDQQLAALAWASVAPLSIDIGAAEEGDAVGLSRAIAGVAETGTLVLASGSGNPVTVGLLPETHIVVLRADTIVASYEEACARVLEANAGAMPRTLNLVTGASRTGDIGGKIVMGAHGPRRLAVVLVAADV
jgi:L-lactate dehydrogenase complex protein LldG